MKSELTKKLNAKYPYEVEMTLKGVGSKHGTTIWFSVSKADYDALIDFAFDCRAKVEAASNESN